MRQVINDLLALVETLIDIITWAMTQIDESSEQLSNAKHPRKEVTYDKKSDRLP